METLVAGSYDRFLFGYQCSTSGRFEDTQLSRKFTYPAHKGPVKCLAASAPYLASGGADDLIHLYDLQTDVDLGFLMSPGDGAVSALAFHASDRKRHPSHLFSGAADGSLSVWQAGGEWICLKTLRGHKKEVNSIAVHHSGRLALSVSQDSTLRLWNLVRGKCAHESKLAAPALQVAFSPSGQSYAIVQGTQVSLQDVGGAPRATLNHPRRALCFAMHSENEMIVGSEEGSIRLWDARSPSKPSALLSQAHQTRIKGLIPSSDSYQDSTAMLVGSASSDGVVKLWDFRMLASKPQGTPVALARALTGARLTCLASLNPSSAVAVKTRVVKTAVGTMQSRQDAAKEELSQRVAPRKAEVSNVKAEKPKASVGIAHDGVVDFPEMPVQGKHKKQKGKVALKAAGASMKLASKANHGKPRTAMSSKGIQSRPASDRRNV